MPNKHIDANINKMISLLTGAGISQDPSARRALASPSQNTNKPLVSPPHFTYNKLNSILHKTVSVVMVLLDASRPRGFRLARCVSSRAFFVGVLFTLTSLSTLEGLAQNQVPTAPLQITLTSGHRQIDVSWTAPTTSGSHTITHYEYIYTTSDPTNHPNQAWTSTGSTDTSYTITGLTNGITYTINVRAVSGAGDGLAGTPVSATPRASQVATAPIGVTLTPGDGQIDVSWTAPTTSGSHTITHYEYIYTTSDPTNHPNQAWTSTGSSNTSYTITGLTNGITYTINVRAVSGAGDGLAGTPVSATPRVPQVASLPTELTATPGDKQIKLSWGVPTHPGTHTITDYKYAYTTSDPTNYPNQVWTSTGSTSTSYTITGLTNGITYSIAVRAVSGAGDGASTLQVSATPQAGLKLPPPPPPPQVQSPPGNTQTPVETKPVKRKIILRPRECPLGWTRGSVFGKTKKALIYELKVTADTTNRISIYQLKSIAIYVHPDENLENLDGWTLKVGTLYNQFGKEFKLTAENSMIDEHDFAHIENPEETPIPMGTLGYIGQSLPSFDYRLYDATGVRVDFGISCYKAGGLTWRLWNTKDPRLLRVLPLGISEEALSVQMQNLNWNTLFFRSEWSAAVMPDLPAAPSQVQKPIVGTWADLKKQQDGPDRGKWRRRGMDL